MPTLPLELLDCSIYLYRSKEAAERGEEAGGSGLVVVVPVPNYPAGTFYAVTNSHVVAAGFTTARLNSADGGHASIELADDHWIRHPEGDDLSIAELDLTAEFQFKRSQRTRSSTVTTRHSSTLVRKWSWSGGMSTTRESKRIVQLLVSVISRSFLTSGSGLHRGSSKTPS